VSDIRSLSVVGGLIRIHHVITRALTVAIENSRSFAERSGYPDASTREGFTGFVLSLVSSLHAHHLTEDDIAFPYFRERIPDAPFDLLAAQHREMIPLLDEIRTTIEEAIPDVQASSLHWGLNLALIRIVEIWCPHIKTEEEHFTIERVNALVNMEEQRRLIQLFSEHSRKHSGPDYLIVPFLLYNLPPEERAILAQEMPPVVTQELVPVVWKEKWAPMKPYLLN
jgi:hypothetical protein